MKTIFSAAILGSLMYCSAASGETLFSDDFPISGGHSWGYYSWEASNPERGGITEEDASSKPKSIAVAAVPKGFAGWHTEPIKLSSKKDFVVKFKFHYSPDYADNQPNVFVSWLGKEKFLGPSFIYIDPKIKESAKVGWTELELYFQGSKAPEGTDSFQVNFISQSDANTKQPAGKVYFDDIVIETRP